MPAMNDSSPARQDKFRRYRARKKAQGLRQIRLWVPDVNAPGFQEKLDRQIAAINASRSNRETLDWIEEVIADDPELYG
ncbi:MAG TPA: antitoxin MazE-like protein [Allosphingosinicella sp.]|nr:antitoxin MazE-like protein [Allosphingosinicella sp.]